MAERTPKFVRATAEGQLWQGEILRNIIQVNQRIDTIGSGQSPVIQEVEHPFAVIFTQNCDLERDFEQRSKNFSGAPTLANVLFCDAMPASSLKALVPPGKDIWKRIIQNNDDRYQCLEAFTDPSLTSEVCPALGIDFKTYFSVPTEEVHLRIRLGQAQRICRLISPYSEHLARRFYNFHSRVAIPQNHDIPL